MSDLLRMTGLYSGMDTESVIQALVSTKQQKVTDLKNDQKKLEWTQEIWQSLNTKIYNLYSKTLSNLRFTSSYAKKTTKVSDPTKATIVAGESAVNGTQTLKINQTAKAGYLTGAVVSKATQGDVKSSWTKDTSLTVLSDLRNTSLTVTVTDTDGTVQNKDITFGNLDTIEDFTNKFSDLGITMTFDEENQQMVLDTNGKTVKMATTAGYSTSALQPFGLGNFGGDELTGVVTGEQLTVKTTIYEKGDFKSDSKVADIDPTLVGRTLTLTVGKGEDAKTTDIEITSDMTISELVNKLQAGGVNASFDETNQRFFISSTGTGVDKEFDLTSDVASALGSLGLAVDPNAELDKNNTSITTLPSGSSCTRVYAQDAEIVLNGAVFTSGSNAFSINGLTINASAPTADDEELTITTDTDYDGIYDMIKDFITEYNEIINEMNKLYNAESARKYSMLTDEQKESMSDDEVEKWEDTIKGALLRKDGTLNSVMNCMKDAISSKYTINGKDMYLKDLGIGTLSYFLTTSEERYALHIDGDPDDESTSSEKDLLKAALIEDPESTIELFAQMAKSMYDSLYDAMGTSEYSSIYKVYDDKKMKTEYDSYTTKIAEAEKALSDYEDKWYSKFSAMEVALSKLQSTQSTISSMLGM